jgi:hypothetical protein
VLAGAATSVHLFLMRASFSGAGFCQASLVETQQAFLEAHVDAFAWFGGVFCEIRFDNLGSAVKQVLRGRRRVETDRFVALRSHYLFESQFTTPGLAGAHEKGGIEGEVGRFRRTHLVPVPQVADLAELNRLLLAGCEADQGALPLVVQSASAVEDVLLLVVSVSVRHGDWAGSRPSAAVNLPRLRFPVMLSSFYLTRRSPPRRRLVGGPRTGVA